MRDFRLRSSLASMSNPVKYKIDLTPRGAFQFWRVDINAWIIKNGYPGLGDDGPAGTVGAGDEAPIRAEFSLAITSSQLREIRSGLNSTKTWSKLESIFQWCGPASDAPLFRQVAHQDLDGKPGVKELLRKFLDEIDGGGDVEDQEDGEGGCYPSLTLLRHVLNNSRRVELRNKMSIVVAPGLELNKEGNICSYNPYASDDLSLRKGPEDPNGKNHPDSDKANKFTLKFLDGKREGHNAREPGDSGSNGPSGRDKSLDPDTDSLTQVRGTADPEESKAFDVSVPSASSVRAGGKPYLKTQLVSVNRLTSKAHRVIFKREEALIISNTGEVKLRASRVGARYYLQELDGLKTQLAPRADLATWHRRLGHIDFRDLYDGYKHHAFRGFKLKQADATTTPFCGICQVIKMPGMPLRQASQGSTELLEIIHADFCGPMSSASKVGVSYFITFTDDASGWSAVYLVKHSSEILTCFKEYAYHVENLLKRKIRSLQSDDDMGRGFDEYLKVKGIARIKAPNDPQHIRTLMETVKCLLMQSGLDSSFWAEAVTTACYIRNRCSTSRLNGMTPHQKWYGKIPSLKHMHEFGARVICKVNKTPEESNTETKNGVFLGYSKKNKGYRVWIPEYQQIVISNEVDFEDYREKSQRRAPKVESESPKKCETVEKLAADEDSNARKNPVKHVGFAIPKYKTGPRFSRFESRGPDYGFSTGPPKYDKNLHDYLKNRCNHSEDESNDEDGDIDADENFDERDEEEEEEDDDDDLNVLDDGDGRDDYINAGRVLKTEPVANRARRRVRPRCAVINHCHVTSGAVGDMRITRKNGEGVGEARAPSFVVRDVQRGKNLKE